jgi:hypothetical protein
MRPAWPLLLVGGACADECLIDGDCEAGRFCGAGACEIGCRSDSDCARACTADDPCCASSAICVANACVPIDLSTSECGPAPEIPALSLSGLRASVVGIAARPAPQ